MQEVRTMICKLLVVLVSKKIITDSDRRYVIGEISEAEWLEEEDNGRKEV